MTGGVKPWISITPLVMGKMALSTILMTTGMYYLTTGRRDGEMSRMISGAVMTLLSLFVFLI
ncbi:MAG: hypothetical protein COV48_15065 [Elusimicrobia bacterium CG11_big_fil_rev_8_21_14_0_20_64_6]|nr:MAG: hypothetical protein COV48_15065 [Elusimicrobia bacterium CG11_big_fil_rev_8_21_14_0_20_64_6]